MLLIGAPLAKLIFKLRDVPIDEILEDKQLLAEHEIETYETSGGMFGLSVAGIWLVDSSQYDSARSLLKSYADERQIRIKLAQSEGAGSWWDVFLRSPIRWLMTVLSVIAVIFLSLWPFINVGVG